jgi:hypothetical protein
MIAKGARGGDDYHKKINSKTTAVPTNHVPMLSRPGDVAAVILAVVEAVR